jgi:beta-galactosidase
VAALVVGLAAVSCAECGNEPRTRESFNKGWRFTLGDIEGAEAAKFDDSAWRTLDVPHDWSIEGDFSLANPSTPGSGALPGGVGWYRKTFVPQNDKGAIYIDFDGVYCNSTVWVNGTELGTRPYGYISFRYDLTPYVKYGEENVIAVRVDNSRQPNSRWYSGSGIYRNVWLVQTGGVHVDNWGTYITTPTVTKDKAVVDIVATVRNTSLANTEATVWTEIYNPKGKRVASSKKEPLAVNAKEAGEVAQQIEVSSPELWSMETPVLYSALTQVEVEGRITDSYRTDFGIRTFEFNPEKGFFLNDKHVKLRGVCLHHDLGCLGSAINIRAIERQLQIMKDMGCNSIRTSHNPPAPELLELCDRMGLVVIDESFDMWRKRKTEFDYAQYFSQWYERDLTDHLLRDRNHPSIAAWSIGNEVLEQWNDVQADTMSIEEANMLLNFAKILSEPQAETTTMHVNSLLTRKLVDMVHSIDPTRPVTAGCNEAGPWNFLFQSGALDLIGVNYSERTWANAPENFPDKSFYISESTSALASRGYYMMPSDTTFVWPVKWDVRFEQPVHQCSAYDNCHVPWGTTHEKSLREFHKLPFAAAMYVWTGFDYLGEPTPFWWPSRSSYFGIVDLAGFPKDSYYLYQSVWTDEDVLHIFPHWNWTEGQEVDVWAYYNNADEVELFLNDTSLGRRAKQGDEMHVVWRVPYTAGTLKAVSYRNGKEVLSREVKTAGEAVSVRLVADREQIGADGDLSFVTVEVLDANGVALPTADNLVRFTIEGGVIAGTDNGDATDPVSLSKPERKLFSGKALAVVKSTERGKIVLTANVEGVGTSSITIRAK